MKKVVVTGKMLLVGMALVSTLYACTKQTDPAPAAGEGSVSANGIIGGGSNSADTTNGIIGTNSIIGTNGIIGGGK